jgi:uncharacterized membrane protein YfcA
MTPDLIEFAKLAPLGFLVGAYGTLVGAGGGSILVPVLLMMMPGESPATITSISLGVVFFNAYSGTIAYMRMGRVDYRAAVLFSAAGLPGAILGVLLVHEVPRQLFDPLFGLLLLGIGALLVKNPLGRMALDESAPPPDRDLPGAVGSAFIAVLSSLVGIGGGVIHVPFLIRVLRQPPHIATATSHFVLTFMALTATICHVFLGEFERGLPQTMYLAIGVMMGAPIGAALSVKMKGSVIVRLLALALCGVGLRLLIRAVT